MVALLALAFPRSQAGATPPTVGTPSPRLGPSSEGAGRAPRGTCRLCLEGDSGRPKPFINVVLVLLMLGLLFHGVKLQLKATISNALHLKLPGCEQEH